MSAALDHFFEHYYRRRPVNATFTGVHVYDAELPDWTPEGLAAADEEIEALLAELSEAHPAPPTARGYRDSIDALDAAVARAYLETQRAERGSLHSPRGNPALWSGEAIFSVASLMIRDFAPLAERLESAARRLEAIPDFLRASYRTMGASALPESWTTRALRECEGATVLFTRGMDAWVSSAPVPNELAARVRAAAASALESFTQWATWLRARPAAPEQQAACGAAMYDVLLAHGHQCNRTRSDLLLDAYAALEREKTTLEAMARELSGSWPEAQASLAALHPEPHDYLATFARIWSACRQSAAAHDVVSWPDWPIRYTTFPEWTRDAAPYLYYLYYRSPAPFDPYRTYDYVVPPLPSADVEKHLRAWNTGVITLNHVVHHGAIGHHVQNWHAYHRASSRVGKIAAVDCASRIGMFPAGTMAEGWACYATQLMDELRFLSPLERLSEQHSRIRFLTRAIVDIEFHQGTFTVSDAVQFHMEHAGMDATVARAEVVKCSMFPATAVMYWIGTQGILDLRATVRSTRGASFSLRQFHDDLLAHGSIPVPLITRLMTEDLT